MVKMKLAKVGHSDIGEAIMEAIISLSRCWINPPLCKRLIHVNVFPLNPRSITLQSFIMLLNLVTLLPTKNYP